MIRKGHLYFWALAFCIVSMPLSAQRRLPDLVLRADAVVVARITGGSNTAQSREIELTVERVLKGELPPGAFVRASFSSPSRAARAAVSPQLEMGLIFLKLDGAGSYSLVSAETGELGLRGSYVPLPETRVVPASPSSVLESVYAEILAGIDARSADERYLRRIVPMLSPAESPVVTSAFQRWATSPPGPLRLLALGSLVGTGSSQALIALKGELTNSPPSPLAVSVATSKLSRS